MAVGAARVRRAGRERGPRNIVHNPKTPRFYDFEKGFVFENRRCDTLGTSLMEVWL